MLIPPEPNVPPPHDDRLRERIVDAAGELLVTRGLSAMTIDEVARRARVNRRTIERRWPSEEALALDVLNHEWKAIAAEIRRGARQIGL